MGPPVIAPRRFRTTATTPREGADVRSSKIKGASEAARETVARVGEQAQIDQLRERLGPVVEGALASAREQAAHAAVAAGHARDWAAPRIEAAVGRGLQAAGPTVEAAADRVAPAVDAARDRIVDDLLPRLVEAVHAASTAALAARAAATESVSHSVEDAARSVANATPTARARRRSRRARLVRLMMTAAAVAAAIAVLRRRSSRPAWEVAPTGVGDTFPVTTPPVARVTPAPPVAAPVETRAEPVAEPTPVAEPVEPVAVEPVAEPVEPVAEPVADVVAPVVPAEPVIDPVPAEQAAAEQPERSLFEETKPRQSRSAQSATEETRSIPVPGRAPGANGHSTGAETTRRTSRRA
jgi:hypothetical protein